MHVIARHIVNPPRRVENRYARLRLRSRCARCGRWRGLRGQLTTVRISRVPISKVFGTLSTPARRLATPPQGIAGTHRPRPGSRPAGPVRRPRPWARWLAAACRRPSPDRACYPWQPDPSGSATVAVWSSDRPAVAERRMSGPHSNTGGRNDHVVGLDDPTHAATTALSALLPPQNRPLLGAVLGRAGRARKLLLILIG
jgi:hypothetical protein